MKLAYSFLALVALGGSAFAAQRYCKVDLRTAFRSTSLNLFPDGTPVYAGVDIQVPASSRHFTTKVTMSGEGKCRVLSVTDSARYATVRVWTDLEIDDGRCEITIRLRDGRKAVVEVDNVGT